MTQVGTKVATALYQAALDTEEQLDAEIERLEKLDADDMEEIRRKRLEAMQYEHSAKKNALAAGTGKYDELKDEKDFFTEAKKHLKMVCVFFRPGTGGLNADTLTKHFEVLAKRYWMVRFCFINAEKAPYLCEKLHIWMLPSMLLIKEGKTEYTIRGFDELGGREFDTDRLEALLSFRDMLPPLEN